MKKTFASLLANGYYVLFYRGSKSAAYRAKALYGFDNAIILRHRRWGFVALGASDSGYLGEFGTAEIYADLLCGFCPDVFKEVYLDEKTPCWQCPQG